MRCELVFEKGSIELPSVPALTERHPHVVSAEPPRRSSYPEDSRPRFAAASQAELSAWVGASLSGRLPEGAATMEQALRATIVADALVTSMCDGGWVPVPSVESVLGSVASVVS